MASMLLGPAIPMRASISRVGATPPGGSARKPIKLPGASPGRILRTPQQNNLFLSPMSARRTAADRVVSTNISFSNLHTPAHDELNNKDRDREEARSFRRTVFTTEDWIRHRRTSRYTRNMTTMFMSRIVTGLSGPMKLTCSLAVIACLFEYVVRTSSLQWVAAIANNFAIPATPFSLTGSLIGLLLVFRTNASYDRWWESRKLWGAVLNRSRDITRQILAYIPDSDKELREKMIRHTMCVSKTLMVHVRDNHDVTEECQKVLKPDEMRMLESASHRPNHVQSVLAKTLARCNIDPMNRASMDSNLTAFADSIGACERILRTPIPLAYTRHTARVLLLWLMFLPFSLVSTCHLNTIPITALTTFLLLGIEELGIQIEEPFSILPLEVISATAESNIKEMSDRNEELNQWIDGSVAGVSGVEAEAAYAH